MTTTFISIIFHIYGGKGHVYSYHLAVNEAIQKLRWNYLGGITAQEKRVFFPQEWNKVYLDNGLLNSERNEVLSAVKSFKLWQFFSATVKLSKEFNKLFKSRICKKGDKDIIFLETFNPLELTALTMALVTHKRQNLSIWLLMRGDNQWGGKKHRFMATAYHMTFKINILFIEFFLKKERVKLLTDSEKLQISLKKYYKRPVFVVPIPHSNTILNHFHDNLPHDSSQKLTCWWPGAPRPEKGLDLINKLIKAAPASPISCTLILPASLDTASSYGLVEIQKVPDYLDRINYDKLMSSTKYILLPYSKELYERSTSGIFTEIVIAGKIPLVTKNTWMSHELEKYGLGGLALDWDKNFYTKLHAISMDTSIEPKLALMKKSYTNYHSTNCLAEIFSSIERSDPQKTPFI